MGKLDRYWKKQKKKIKSKGPQERIQKVKVPSTFGDFKEIEIGGEKGGSKIAEIISRFSTGRSRAKLIKPEDY